MDILNPELIWINGRCYRKFAVHTVLTNPEEKDDTYIDRVDDDDFCEDLEDDIKELKYGNFQGSVCVPTAFFSYVVGSKGNTKRRVETETGTKMMIPSMGREGDVVISGRSRKSVSSAMRRVKLLVENIRRKTAFTHFVCLPFNLPEFQLSFVQFKDKVLEKCSEAEGVNETLFQKPEKMHLTICTLVLMDERERKMAAEILQECQEEIIKPILKGKPLEVAVEGIEYMNDDPSAVDVLYAKVKLSDGSDRLQVLAQEILDKFISSGLTHDQYERVKLHITLINTRFGKPTNNSVLGGKSRNSSETFNATHLLKEFGNYHFAVLEIPEIHISVLHSYASSRTGFYSSTASIQLNS